MRRSRKPLCVVRRTEGSNPSPSALRTKSGIVAGKVPAVGDVLASPYVSAPVHTLYTSGARRGREIAARKAPGDGGVGRIGSDVEGSTVETPTPDLRGVFAKLGRWEDQSQALRGE